MEQPPNNYYKDYYLNNKDKFKMYYVHKLENKKLCEICNKSYINLDIHYKSKKHIKNI